MKALGQRLVFSRLRADLGTEAVTSLLQLPMYVLDNKMDRDSVAQRRMKICLQIEVDCQRSAVSYTPDQKKKCSLLVFPSSGYDDVGVHHGRINEVFHRRFDESFVLTQNAAYVSTTLQNIAFQSS